LSRLAANRVRRAGAKLEPLLSRVGLTLDQIDDPEQRIDAGDQIAFLEIAAEVLNDEFLGFRLAEEFDCRDLGLLYYVMASCDTLGGALKRASRYSRITNEAIVLQYRELPEPTLRLSYSGIPRHADRHQIEFCIVAMVRVSLSSADGSSCPSAYPWRMLARKEFRNLPVSLETTSNLAATPTR
jgi:hypothetical protein